MKGLKLYIILPIATQYTHVTKQPTNIPSKNTEQQRCINLTRQQPSLGLKTGMVPHYRLGYGCLFKSNFKKISAAL